ncbi:MAG: hypothetical protein U0936_23660 [Planctomycetaceae bacterium]
MFNRCILCFTAAIMSVSAFADETSRQAVQPIAIVRYAGINADTTEAYFRKLRDDLGIGAAINDALNRNTEKESVTKHENPVSGMLVYLGEGLLPSLEQVQFSEVVDHAEFVRLINARSEIAGPVSKLEGSGDLYSMVVTNTWRVEESMIQPASSSEVLEEPATSNDSSTPEGTEAGIDETPPSNSGNITVSIGASSGTGIFIGSSSIQSEGKLLEENGKKFREYSSQSTNYFRFHDGFMFESQTKGLHEMSLPSGDSLRQLDNSDVNGEVTFYPDRIPMGLRMLGWNALSTAAGAELQQRDEEPDADYAVRRSAGDAGLALIRSAMFDTEKVSTWLKLAFDDNPIQGEFRISSRNNSDLGRTLREVSSAERRFAPILNDDAAATVYLAAHLPEEWRNVVSAYLATVTEDVTNSPDHNEAERAAQLTWFNSFASLAEHGNVEFCAKIGWSKESGGVVYGGVQLNDNPELLAAIQAATVGDGEQNAQSEMVQLHDMPMLKMLVPADAELGHVKLTHVYLANADSCLWFAMGGENAHEIIHQSVTRCREAAGRISTPVFTAAVDLQRWADYPQNDATGLTTLHLHLYSGVSSLLAFITEDFMWSSETDEEEADTSHHEAFQRAMSLGGSRAVSFTVDTDESGFVARGSVGNAVARGYAAAIVIKLDELLQNNVTVKDSEPSK